MCDVFIDDGYTGTNYKRPGFIRMMSAIENDEANCIIVKDLSRFGRNYIETGRYLEEVLPQYNCRFISILDNLDSYENPQAISGIFVQFKNIMNDHYSSQISQSMRYAYDEMRKQGKLVSANAPFGYIKDPLDRHHLVIDREAAEIIRNIYNWKLSGMGVTKIAQKLNSLGVLSITRYFKEKGIYKNTSSTRGSLWDPTSVRRILNNKVYMGMLEQKKYTFRSHKDKKKRFLDEKDRIVVYNTHEPIIDTKLFYSIQKQFNKDYKTITAPNEQMVHKFSGLLRCKDCGAILIRTSRNSEKKRYIYYRCKTYTKISPEKCPHKCSISNDLFESAVLYTIKAQIRAVADMKNVISKINNVEFVNKKRKYFKKTIRKYEAEIDKNYSFKKDLYEDFKLNIITEQDFKKMNNTYDEEVERIARLIDGIKVEEQSIDDIENSELHWMEAFLNNCDIKILTRELLIALVDRIYVDSDNNITIDFLYNNEFITAIDYVTGNLRKEA